MSTDLDTMMGGAGGQFPTTMWSSVFQNGERSSERFRDKVEGLLARYWKPIYRTIRITWNKSNEEAKDLTQSFMLMVLEDDLVKRFCPNKGRFRSFLKAALGYFLVDEERARKRIKRGGDRKFISLDMEADTTPLEPADLRTSPEEILDREWADTLLEESIEELRTRLESENRVTWFKVYETIDLTENPDGPPTYAETARLLNLKETDVNHYLHAARQRLRRILIERIGEYALDEDEIYDELNHIYSG